MQDVYGRLEAMVRARALLNDEQRGTNNRQVDNLALFRSARTEGARDLKLIRAIIDAQTVDED